MSFWPLGRGLFPDFFYSGREVVEGKGDANTDPKIYDLQRFRVVPKIPVSDGGEQIPRSHNWLPPKEFPDTKRLQHFQQI
eukprot:2804259-Amphidinium_carterae.1